MSTGQSHIISVFNECPLFSTLQRVAHPHTNFASGKHPLTVPPTPTVPCLPEPPAPQRIRAACSTCLTVPCAQRYSPHRAVPRRTAPSHTAPHPHFVLFQREPPLFCLPQRVVRRKMRLATNESAPKGCCFFSTGLPEWVRAAGRPFCHGVIHQRS